MLNENWQNSTSSVKFSVYLKQIYTFIFGKRAAGYCFNFIVLRFFIVLQVLDMKKSRESSFMLRF